MLKMFLRSFLQIRIFTPENKNATQMWIYSEEIGSIAKKKCPFDDKFVNRIASRLELGVSTQQHNTHYFAVSQTPKHCSI